MTVQPSNAFPAQQARTRQYRVGTPHHFVVSPDDRRVAFLRAPQGSDAANQLVVASRDLSGSADGALRETVVADPVAFTTDEPLAMSAAERDLRERTRDAGDGITSFATDRDVTVASFCINGRVGIADLTGATSARILDLAPGAFDPRVDPTGRHVAWVAGGCLWVAGLDGTSARRLVGRGADPADAGDVRWGTAEFIAAEELGRHRGYWWSPDGTSLLVCRVDERAVGRRHLSDPADPAREPRCIRYPAAGQANASVSLWLTGIDGDCRRVDWDAVSPDVEYLAAVRWCDRGDALAVLLDRPQTSMTTVAIDRDGACRVVSRVIADPWIEAAPGAPAWFSGGRLASIRPDVAADSHRLFLDSVPLTPSAFQVSELLHVADDGFLVRGSESAVDSEVWHVGPDGRMTQLSPETGSNAFGRPALATAVRGTATAIIVASSLERTASTAQWVTWDPADGRAPIRIAGIESRAEVPVIEPRVSLARLGDRALHAAIQWPRDDVRPAGPLPILLNPYGGPGVQRVVASGRAYLESQWFADHGFCVVIADGRGSPGRGPTFEHAVAGDLATPALDDQVAVLDALAARHGDELDFDHVGIMGWSFGGYLAALAVMRRPERFHAAVAGAPVSDWRMYDTAYTERYLGDPVANAASYEAASLIPDAAHLERPLLLIHGMADDNVLAAHSLRLSQALTTGGKAHSFLPLSDVTHSAPPAALSASLLRLQAAFLCDALGVTSP